MQQRIVPGVKLIFERFRAQNVTNNIAILLTQSPSFLTHECSFLFAESILSKKDFYFERVESSQVIQKERDTLRPIRCNYFVGKGSVLAHACMHALFGNESCSR